MRLDHPRCSFASSLDTFLSTGKEEWLARMEARESGRPLHQEQIAAWADCYDVLLHTLPAIQAQHPELIIIFEYELPYEAGRRPDVILLSKEQVVILEFKMKCRVLRADVDQVAAYARDLQEYHFESRNRKVTPLLVVTRMKHTLESRGSVLVTSGDCLQEALLDTLREDTTACDAAAWMSSRYEPLPTIVETAQRIMRKEALPQIRSADSAGIPQALHCLTGIATYAHKKGKHMLAFVTGVPGAGKTYLGLQYVYESFQAEKQVHSVYLSGNGPLVKVLSSALGSHVFVKDLHKQIDEFVRYQAKDFHQNIIVFDEGQRAWTQERMAQRNPGRQCSEAELMLQLAEARLPWCVLLVLIGEGQEIYKGESAGVDQWVTAISRTQQAWEIVAPSKLTVSFEPVQTMCYLHARDQLDLNVSLRNHLAQDASTFINHLISGEINQAKSLVPSLKSAGYTMLVTQDLDAAKAYCTTRYKGQTSKRYGLLVSSKAETALMRRYGVDNSYEATSMRNMDIAAWYNDPPESPKSCCSFRQVVTEFSCQGLEVDLPILCWGPDMIWNGNAWNLYRPMQSADSNDNRYRVNSYRVLLTRGRDGLLVFVPPESKLFPIYDLLRRVGLEEL